MSGQLEGGKKNLAANELDKAEACFRTLVNANHELGDAYYGLGLVQLRRKDMHGARENFTRAIKAEPGNINALLRLADIAASTGDTRMAISLYSRVLVQNPDSSRAISGIAKLSGSTEPASQVAAPKQATTPPASGPTYPPRFQNSLVGVVTDLNKSNAPWRGRMKAYSQLVR